MTKRKQKWEPLDRMDYPLADDAYPYRLQGWEPFKKPSSQVIKLVRGGQTAWLLRGQLYTRAEPAE